MQSTIQKLDKCRASINAHIGRGNYLVKGQRALDLHYRYTALIDQAKNENVWEKYCNGRFFSTSHNAGDLWA